MNRFRNLIALFAFSLLIFGLPSIVSAQWRNNRNDNGNYGNNNRNYNRNLQSTIRNLKNNSSNFQHRLDRELDNSRYDGTNCEDRIMQIAKDFKEATKQLDKSYDNQNDYDRSRNEAQRVLQLGSQLERVLSRSRLNQNLSSDWSRIRQDLSVLANAYNTNYNNRGGRNRNGDDGYYDNNDDDYNRNTRNNRRTNDDDDNYNRNNRNNRRTNNNIDWRRAIPFPLPF